MTTCIIYELSNKYFKSLTSYKWTKWITYNHNTQLYHVRERGPKPGQKTYNFNFIII